MTKPAGGNTASPERGPEPGSQPQPKRAREPQADRGPQPQPEPALEPSFDPELLVVPGVALRRAELRWRFSRAGGPGGQNVNKTDSRVELVFPLASSASLPEGLRRRALARLAPRLVAGELVVVAEEHRSQWRNRQAALVRLMALLRGAITPPPPPRRPTRPGRGAVERRLETKRRRSARKQARRGPLNPAEE